MREINLSLSSNAAAYEEALNEALRGGGGYDEEGDYIDDHLCGSDRLLLEELRDALRLL